MLIIYRGDTIKKHKICIKCGKKQLITDFNNGYCIECNPKPTDKYCFWCDETLPIEQFTDMQSEEDNKDYLCVTCRDECETYKKSIPRCEEWKSLYTEDILNKTEPYLRNMVK